MIDLVFSFFSHYLIEFMGVVISLALVFRWFAYRASKLDSVYYTSFTRELQLNVEKDKEADKNVDNIDSYLDDILARVSSRLPKRSLRYGKKEKAQASKSGKNVYSLREYVDGKHGFITNIQSESSVFSCSTPPNFAELTQRIMNQDQQWVKILKHIPIVGVSRMIDILPGIFVVLGVFGTFIGISMALPEIATMDFNNLEASGDTLTQFVLKVTFAMKTSIAGIFFSLVLTVLNTLFPIKDRRQRVFKSVESSLQMLWYHVQNDKKEHSMESILSKLATTLESLDKSLSKEKKAS